MNTADGWKRHERIYCWNFMPDEIPLYIRARRDLAVKTVGPSVDIRIVDLGDLIYEIQTREQEPKP